MGRIDRIGRIGGIGRIGRKKADAEEGSLGCVCDSARDPGLAHKALFYPGGLEDGTQLAYYIKGKVRHAHRRHPMDCRLRCCPVAMSG